MLSGYSTETIAIMGDSAIWHLECAAIVLGETRAARIEAGLESGDYSPLSRYDIDSWECDLEGPCGPYCDRCTLPIGDE